MMQLPIQDPLLVFAVVMLVILLAPIAFARLRLSGIVALIIAGMLLGPYALRVLERNQTIEMLGAVGLLFIMFLAGLEIDLHQFLRHRNHSLAFGALTFAIPMGLGVGAGVFLLGMDWLGAVLLASMFASHTLLSYPVVSGMGLTRNRAVTTTIGGTMITDTAALLALAVVAGAMRGGLNILFWAHLFGFLALYVFMMLWALPLLARWFFVNVASDGVMEFVFVMAALFLCSWLAHLAGLEPILGAFLAGLAFNRLVPAQSVLMSRVHFIGQALFIPFFLISVGMLINLRLVASSLRLWMFAAVMLVTAVVSKWLAARLIRVLLHYTPAEGGMIFGLSVNQAAATLAAVMVGFELGLFGEEILAGAVIMILGTCMLGPWLTEKHARRVAVAEKQQPYDHSMAPARVVVPLANPATEQTLMDLALLLRPANSTEPVYPLTVTSDGPDAEARVAAGEALLEHAVVHAAAANAPVVPVTRVDTSVANGIIGALRDLRGSIVIIGWNGEVSGTNRVFGAVIDGVARMSQQMLLVARVRRPLNVCSRLILIVPPLAERQPGFVAAIATIKLLAQRLGARLLTMTAPESDQIQDVLARAKPALPMDQESFGALHDLAPLLKRRHADGDLLVLLAARQGRLAWQPRMDRLPRLISQTVPAADLLVVYPPEMRWQETASTAAPADPWLPLCGIPAPRAWFDQDGVRLQRLLPALLAPALSATPALWRRATAELARVSQNDPVEITVGMVLLHIHLPELSEPLLFLAVNRHGFDLPNVSAPPRVLLILLAAGGQPPEAHLRVLADLARMAHAPDLVEKLCAASSLPDFLSRATSVPAP